MSIRAKSIKLVDVDKITPNAKNANHHPKEQIERLKEIIKYQGFRVPVIISNQSKTLVSGHGRLLAAKELGLKKIPALFQDFDSNDQEYAAMISDNTIPAWAELDLSSINEHVVDLGPDFDLNVLGMDNFTLDMSEKSEKKETKEKDKCPTCGK